MPGAASSRNRSYRKSRWRQIRRGVNIAPCDRHSSALVMLLLAASIGACGTTIDLHKRAVQGVIDGQEVGALACGPGAFGPLGEPLCGRFIDLARTQLDREQPGHVAILDVEV